MTKIEPNKDARTKDQPALTNLIENAVNQHVIVCVTDATGKILSVNDKFAEISGYTIDDLCGKNQQILSSGLHPKALFDEMMQTISNGQIWSGEIRNRHKDGSLYWLKSTIIPELDKTGKPIKFVSVSTDITDIKAAQEALHVAKSFDLINDEVYMFRPSSFALMYLNPRALEQAGWQAGEVTGKTIWDLNESFEVRHEMFEHDNLKRELKKLKSENRSHFIYQFKGRGAKWYEGKFQIVKPEFQEEYVIVSFWEITKQVFAENQAHQLALTLNHIHHEVYIFRPKDLKFMYVNRAAMLNSGLSEAELLKLTPIDLNPDFTEETFRDMLQPLIDQGKGTLAFESLRREKNRPPVPVEVTLDYINLHNEQPRFIAVVKDISERNAAEREINQFKHGFDLGQNQIYMFWPETLRLIYANKAALAASDLDADTYKKFTIRKRLSKRQLDRFLARARPVTTGEQNIAVTKVFDKRTSRNFEETIQLIKPEGDKPRFFVIYRDITDHVAADRQVLLLKASLDMMNASVQMYRPDTLEFIYMNRVARELLGWKEDEWRNKKVGDISPLFDEKRYRRHIAPLMAGDVNSIVYETLDEHGNPIEVTEQLQDAETVDARIVAVVRDISDRKEVEKKKSEFVSTVSHELRTPLTAIKGALGLIQAGLLGDVPEKIQPMIHLAHRNSETLGRLIDDILDFEKITSGNMALNFEPLNIADFLVDIINLNQPYARQYDVSMAFVGTKEPCYMLADALRMQQVLSNLLSNAAKFSNKGGAVEVGFNHSDGIVRIFVRDQGCGIPDRAKATIFDRFTQADSSDVRKTGGTGLGLSIAKEIIERHGGNIWFESTQGKGTTFYFELVQDVHASAEPVS